MNQLDLQLTNFIIIFTRIISMLMADVLIGSSLVPLRYRLMLGITLSIIVYPLVTTQINISLISIQGAIIITQQILLGIIIAAIFQFIFQIVLFAGQIIANQTGLGFGQPIGMISQVYYLAALFLFLTLNGHLTVIQCLVHSFSSMPLTTMDIDFTALANYSSIIFSGGISIALPCVTAMLIVNIAFAVMTRTTPQINMFNIGFPVTIMLAFVIIFITFTGVMSSIQQFFADGFSMLQSTLGIR